jgi:hypothetical protein
MIFFQLLHVRIRPGQLKTFSHFIIITPNSTIITMSDFATQILQRLQQVDRNDDESFGMSSLPLFVTKRRLSTNSSNLKRLRQEAFDMSVVLEASKQVEDSIAFPVIEWPSLDIDDNDSEKDDDDEEDDDEDCCCFSTPPKRQCRGLVRCSRSSNLSTMTCNSSSNLSGPAVGEINSVQRHGSNGSLV